MTIRATRPSNPFRPLRTAASLIRPTRAIALAPEQLHVQFGADAATQVAVSWAVRVGNPFQPPATALRPRLRLGQAASARGVGAICTGSAEVPAVERRYTDALTGETVVTYHARIDSLEPDTSYVYEVLHDGAPPAAGTFRTGPRGRSAGFTLTSLGDQSIPAPVGEGLGPSSPNAGFVVDAVEALDPLFHLMNGDLSYANSSDQPVATWASYFDSIARAPIRGHRLDRRLHAPGCHVLGPVQRR